ncbi:hypothetical protein ACQ4M4_15805 [Leptolyngbya sp. AN02str]
MHSSLVLLELVIKPLNLWSLWVPIALLGLIIAIAIYFVRLPQ